MYSYCPGGPDSDFEYSTQSYTGYEVHYSYMCDKFNMKLIQPTSMRAIRARYNPYLQAKHRIEQVSNYRRGSVVKRILLVKHVHISCD